MKQICTTTIVILSNTKLNNGRMWFYDHVQEKNIDKTVKKGVVRDEILILNFKAYSREDYLASACENEPECPCNKKYTEDNNYFIP